MIPDASWYLAQAILNWRKRSPHSYDPYEVWKKLTVVGASSPMFPLPQDRLSILLCYHLIPVFRNCHHPSRFGTLHMNPLAGLLLPAGKRGMTRSTMVPQRNLLRSGVLGGNLREVMKRGYPPAKELDLIPTKRPPVKAEQAGPKWLTSVELEV